MTLVEAEPMREQAGTIESPRRARFQKKSLNLTSS
jgi:hypothetical protein